MGALTRAYAASMQAAVERFGTSRKELLVIEDAPRFLELAEALPTRDRYVRGATNVFEEVVTSVAEGSTPAVRAFVLGTMRVHLIDAFAFAVPNGRALKRIAALGPLVEVGCGSGYWARCLSDMGTQLAAYDKFEPGPPEEPHVCHHPTRKGDPAFAMEQEPGARTLLLCWPVGIVNMDEVDEAPRFSSMGSEALSAFGGEHVVFVGERSQSFGSPEFFAHLDREFKLLERIAIPNLAPWKDSVWVYRRRS